MKKFINYSVLLLLGFALGMSSSHLVKGRHFRPPPHDMKDGPRDPSEHFVERLTKHLKLDEDQKAKALSIFKVQHEKLEEIRKQTVPQFESIREETRKGIRELLNSEQQSIFDSSHGDRLGRRPHFGRRPPRFEE